MELFLVSGSPRLLSLHIVGNAVEGTMLRIEKTYWGGDEGDSIYRWLRVLRISTFLFLPVFVQNSKFNLEWPKSYIPFYQCLNCGLTFPLHRVICACSGDNEL